MNCPWINKNDLSIYLSIYLSIGSARCFPNSSKASNKTKLPKLVLPKFAGDHTKWTTFSDGFSSAIHANDELNEVDKFQYLRSLLEGCAAETISGLPLTSSNYKHAVDVLTFSRFGSKLNKLPLRNT